MNQTGADRLRGKYGSALGSVVIGMLLSVNIAHAQAPSPSIQVTVNQSVVFRLTQKAKRVSVTQPEIAEVVVVTPNQLLINGKGVGTTSFVVWDESDEATKFDLLVTPDIASLRNQLRALFPEDKIEVSNSGTSIVLKGEVSNEVVYDKVLKVAQTFLPPAPGKEVAAPPAQNITVTTPPIALPQTGTAFAGGGQLAFPEENALTDADRWPDRRVIPGIIDLLRIKEFRQIELNVIVAEVSLTKLRELGIDFGVIGKHFNFLSLAGSQSGFSSGGLFSDPSTFPPTVTFGGGTSAIMSYLSDRVKIATLYRLFQNRDITQILARPRLVIKNGRSGGFLAGGEFPVAIATGDQIAIEFKPFGVRLDFLPTLTWSETIDLRVFPEVSEIDTSVSTTIQGITIPGLRVRRSVSRVEMKENETLVMSGLLDRRTIRDMTKFPLLGDIPILGGLFRGTRFRDQESELVFVVTPHIVKALRPGVKPHIPSSDKYDQSDMRQIPLPKSSSPSAPQGPTIP